MPRYKLSSKSGVVHMTGSASTARRVARALATATGSEVHGEVVSAPKRRRKKAAPKPKPARKKRSKPRRAKRRSRKQSKRRSRKASKRR